MIKASLTLCLAALAALPALADSVPQPEIKAQDSWTYSETNQLNGKWSQKHTEYTVERASRAGILLAIREVGSTQAANEQMVNPDWSRVRSVNGKETVVNRPFAFPLEPNKSWEVDYTEDHPNRAHKSERFHSPYSVVGWEDVTVPAGTFKALKIEADGNWTAEIEPASTNANLSRSDSQGTTQIQQSNTVMPTTATGRTYKAFWYVPAIKRWVKFDEEYYGNNGGLTERHAGELESYKVGE